MCNTVDMTRWSGWTGEAVAVVCLWNCLLYLKLVVVCSAAVLHNAAGVFRA